MKKNGPGKDIQGLGGAKLAATVMDAGLVDEYRLTITWPSLAKANHSSQSSSQDSFLKASAQKVFRQGLSSQDTA